VLPAVFYATYHCYEFLLPSYELDFTSHMPVMGCLFHCSFILQGSISTVKVLPAGCVMQHYVLTLLVSISNDTVTTNSMIICKPLKQGM
jgi:hypothetical protein